MQSSSQMLAGLRRVSRLDAQQGPTSNTTWRKSGSGAGIFDEKPAGGSRSNSLVTTEIMWVPFLAIAVLALLVVLLFGMGLSVRRKWGRERRHRALVEDALKYLHAADLRGTHGGR